MWHIIFTTSNVVEERFVMGIISGIVVFIMVWWTVLFAVLPWGIRHSETLQTGNVASAPDKPKILQKFLITTGITCVVWLIIYGLINANVISFYDMAEQLAQHDAAP
jgi:predicted secreted protein